MAHSPFGGTGQFGRQDIRLLLDGRWIEICRIEMRQLFLFLLFGMGMQMPGVIGQINASELRVSSLKSASAYSAGRRGYSFLVIQDGRVIFESYANGDSRGSDRSDF